METISDDDQNRIIFVCLWFFRGWLQIITFVGSLNKIIPQGVELHCGCHHLGDSAIFFPLTCRLIMINTTLRLVAGQFFGILEN